MKQIRVNADGLVVLRADTNFLNDGCIKVSSSQWEALLSNPGAFKWVDGDLVAIEEAPTETYRASVPVLCSMANFQMMEGDVSAIDLTAGFSIIFAIEPGKVWAFFETPMADLNYSWNINSTGGRVRVTSERTTDYLEIEAADDSGEPLSGATVALQVYKVNS